MLNQTNIKRRKCILMASFPHRHDTMLSAINQLIDQCDDFYLYLNQYKEIPDELLEYGSKMHIKVDVPDLKDNGRYTFLDECKEDYCFICDDDFYWPSDYIQNTLDVFARHGDDILVTYLVNKKLFEIELKDDVKIQLPKKIIGSGMCAFIPSRLKLEVSFDELKAGYDYERFICNAYLRNKLSLYIPKKKANYLKPIEAVWNDMFALRNRDRSTRIRNTNKYILLTDRHRYKTYIKIDINDLVKNSFVLSINDKRLQFFYKQWKALGLPLKPKYVAGLQLNKNKSIDTLVLCKKQVAKTQISCMSSHLMIVSMAKTMQLPFVCIFEDDAVGCINCKNKLEQVCNNIPEDTDVLMLGNLFTQGIIANIDKRLIQPKFSSGMQSYIVFAKAYDKFISKLNSTYFGGISTGIGNSYLVKDILFCQYNLLPETAQIWNKDKNLFFHNSLSKNYLDKHFKIIDLQ